MNPQTALMILRMVDLLAAGLQLAPEIRARYAATSAKVKKMVTEGREPTPEEWAALDAETDDLLAQINAG